MMAAVLFLGFIMLILMRVPVSIAIGAAVVAAFATSDFSGDLYIIPQQILDGVNKPSLAAVPFFIMAGNLMNVVGMTDRIFAFRLVAGRPFPGGPRPGERALLDDLRRRFRCCGRRCRRASARSRSRR